MAEEDAIFAKQMHFYGGVEPSNMLVFDASFVIENGKSKAKITATLPNDTVINDQTLCTVGGAIIRRKEGSVPVNEFDGELFADIQASGIFYDESVEVNKTYSYAAFPYTTQGVYNRNLANVSTVTVLNGYPPEPLIRLVSTLNFTDDGAFVMLSFVHPGNTKINGEAVNTLAGIKLCRSTTGFPINETQGELVKDFKVAELSQTGSLYQGSYIDGPMSANTTYYYTAFPYTTQNIYNRSSLNRTSIFVTAGPAPDDMSYFTVTPIVIGQNAAVAIDADMSSNELSDVQCTSVAIRRKIGSDLTSSDDGDLIVTFNADDPIHWCGHHRFIDEEVVDGLEYHYRAFPTSPTGSINTNDVAANKRVVTAKATWIFACAVINGVANPNDAVTYQLTDIEKKLLGIDHVDNENFTPANMNFETGIYEPGDWDFIPGTFFMPKPCIMDPATGKVDFYLNPNDYNYKEDLTESLISSIDNKQAMVEWNKLYSRSARDTSADRMAIAISNKPIQLGDRPVYNFAAFEENQYNDYFYSSIFPAAKATKNDDVMGMSISGKAPFTYTANDNNAMEYIRTTNVVYMGSSILPFWDCEPAIDFDLFRYLLILMGKSLNIKEVFGYGTHPLQSPSVNGLLNNKGMFYGYSINAIEQNGTSTPNLSVKVFGMESLWGTTYGTWEIGKLLTTYGKDVFGDGTSISVLSILKCLAPWQLKQNPELDGMGTYRKGFFGSQPASGLVKHMDMYWIDNVSEGQKKAVEIGGGEYGYGYISELTLASEYGMGDFFEVMPLNGNSSGTVIKQNNLQGSATTYTSDFCYVTQPLESKICGENWINWHDKNLHTFKSGVRNYLGGNYVFTEEIGRMGLFSIQMSPANTNCIVRLRFTCPHK